MDNRSIFSKTGKGSLEITKKTFKLSSEERQALILVDGKSNYGELQEKLSRVPAVKLRAVFEKLADLELIREFVAKSTPAAAPASASQNSAPALDDDDELDFTSLAPAGPAASAAPAPTASIDRTISPSRRVQEPAPAIATAPAIDAAEEARKFQEMMFGGSQPDPQAEAAEAARIAGEEAQRKAAETEALRKAEVARKVAEDQARRKAEVERVAREAAARDAEAAEAQRKAADEEARRNAEAEQAAREAAAREAAEAEARRKAEAERLAREEAARKAEAERLQREAREREEAVRRAAEEEARRRAEAERLAHEAAARKAAEEEARRRAEAERVAQEEAARKAEAERIEREAREREEAARRAAEEEARRRAEAERAAREAAERAAREEAARKAAEEEARRIAEVERIAREEAARRAEAERIEREAREAREREEAGRRAAEEEARRKAEGERVAREAQEREEAARRKAEAERAARDERERQEREQFAREQAARRAAEETTHQQALQSATSAERAAAEAEQKRNADEEAARYVAALTPQIEAVVPAAPLAAVEPTSLDFDAEAKAAFDADLNFAPQTEEGQRKAEVDRLMMGAFADTPAAGEAAAAPNPFVDTSGNSIDPATEGGAAHKELESASRKEIEREAKERAKADAKAKKAAEKEAKRLAKDSKVSIRRSGPSVATLAFGAVAVALIGAVAYLFLMPIDKAAIERALTDRLGEAVTVGTAKFSPFPPQLDLVNVSIGSIKFASVVANPDPATLITERKIWKSIDATGVTISAEDARKLVALATRTVPASAAAKVEIQRVKMNGVEITGMPVAMPKFDFVALLNPAGALKQVTLSLPDGKAQARLAPDENGWGVDIESRGTTWPLGPKVAWEAIRARGAATVNGIKFDEYTITQFGGSGRGAGELSWKDGWKFNGNVDVSNFDIEALGNAFYGASPASGSMDGKFSVVLNAPSVARLFDAPQIDGAFIANKAAAKSIDLARTAQTGAVVPGATRFSDFSATLAIAGGKLQVKELKGISGLLTVSGAAEVPSDKSLGGALTVELGVGGSRAKAILKLSGTLAEPKLTK